MLQICPRCGVKVVPIADGKCPSCRETAFPTAEVGAKVEAVEGLPLEVDEVLPLEADKPAIDARRQRNTQELDKLLNGMALRMRILGIVWLIVAPSAALVTVCFNFWLALAYLFSALGGLLLIQTAHAFRECAVGGRWEDLTAALRQLDVLLTYQFVVVIVAWIPAWVLLWTYLVLRF